MQEADVNDRRLPPAFFHDSPVTQKYGAGFCLQFETVVSVDDL